MKLSPSTDGNVIIDGVPCSVPVVIARLALKAVPNKIGPMVQIDADELPCEILQAIVDPLEEAGAFVLMSVTTELLYYSEGA